MTFFKWMGSAAIMTLLCSACSGADVDGTPGASEADVASAQAEIAVGDTTNQVCFNADTPLQCDMHDGTFIYTSGLCTIRVNQQCTWVGGECRCFVKVTGTMGPCGPKGWGDFFNHC